jgi:hypothetical protein
MDNTNPSLIVHSAVRILGEKDLSLTECLFVRACETRKLCVNNGLPS